MNIFNRIIMVIAMLCLIVFSIVAIVNIFADLFEWSEIFDRILNFTASLNQYALAAILFLIFVIALVILIFEFRRKKPDVASIFVDSTGKTTVSYTHLSRGSSAITILRVFIIRNISHSLPLPSGYHISCTSLQGKHWQ